jgi:hypothetical protein
MKEFNEAIARQSKTAPGLADRGYRVQTNTKRPIRNIRNAVAQVAVPPAKLNGGLPLLGRGTLPCLIEPSTACSRA